MTVRGATLAVSGAALLLLGRALGWPELAALGGAALALVAFALVLAGRRPSVSARLLAVPRSAVRGTEAVAVVAVQADHRSAGLRLVLGPPARPLQTVLLPRLPAGQPQEVAVPLDTSRRGVQPAGPWSLVREDPWGLVRRAAPEVEGSTVTVHPRTVPVARNVLPGSRPGDSDASTRRPGEEHFHALREYVLGDEPRAVHWRSSARAGHLVVRQHVSAATDAVVVMLDVDAAAYGSGSAFAQAFSTERFEEAVDVAASLAAGQRLAAQQVHLTTTARAARTSSAGTASSAPVLDALAVVRPLAPVEVAPEQLRTALRRLPVSRVLAVSGDPDSRLVTALQGLGRRLPVLLVRVGSTGAPVVTGLRTVDVDRADDLSRSG